jgi:cytochrome P450
VLLDDCKILPKGVDIFISIADIHRDPESFPKPDEFDPDRFSVERAATLDPWAFIPFSMGIRNCIGTCCVKFEGNFHANPCVVKCIF